MNLNILVFYGSVRHHRQGIKAVRFVMNELTARGHSAEIIDQLEYNFPLLDKMYKEYEKGGAPNKMELMAGKIKKADAFVVVSGEYNHSIPPALSNLMDHFMEEYFSGLRPLSVIPPVSLAGYARPCSYVLFCQKSVR